MTRTTAARAERPAFTPGEPTVYRGREEFAAVTRALRGTGRRIALVPTMGALHAGHRALIDAARRVAGTTVAVSIFVNPLQFGANEDLGSYPRKLDADLQVCAEAGAELVFAPSAEEMYPNGAPGVTVVPGELGDLLEGASRPGHFAGVLTVVAKLLGIARPDSVFFGEKDYQQLVLVGRMAADLDMGTQVVGVPTVREPDGLALSSRNAYLDAAQRESAVGLSAALAAGVAAGHRGEDPLRAAREVLAAASGVEPDYLQLRAPDLGPPSASGPARLLVAARVGTTRLIDNAAVELGGRNQEGN